MNRLQETTIKRHILPLLLMCGTFFIGIAVLITHWIWPNDNNYPVAVNGELKAAGWDFSQMGVIPLKGEWEFYEGELLQPDDFTQSNHRAPSFVQVPSSFAESEDGSRPSYGTYRLKIYVDESDSFSLRLKKVRLSNHVFINGEDYAGSGRPAQSEASFVASIAPYFTMFNVENGVIELIIQVASFDNMNGGIAQAPEFGLTKDVIKRQEFARLSDVSLITALFMFGLYYVGMFRHWRREPHLKYFSLFCLLLAFFFAIDNELLILLFFPNFSFLWLQKLLFLLPLITIYFFGQYVLSYLRKTDMMYARILPWIALVYALFAFVTPNRFLVDFLWAHVVLASLYLGLLFLAIFSNRERPVQGKGYLLLGLLALLAMWIFAQFRYQMALDSPYFMVLSPLMLVLSQALLMADRLHDSYVQNEKMNRQLLAFDRQKDEFLAKTSHELRTPLHGIINLSQIMLEDKQHSLPAEHLDNIRLVQAIGNRLAGLVHDVLDLNKIRYGQLKLLLKPVDLTVSVEFVIQTLSVIVDKPGVKIVNDIPAGLPLVWTDEDRLQQVLYNLVENGLKFTESGHVRVHAAAAGKQLNISVSDTGIGIPEERLDSLFRPFTSYDEHEGWHGGLGLGLSIAKELIEQQQGTLSVSSQEGVGTTFTFTLPVSSEKTATQPRISQQSYSSLDDYEMVAATEEGLRHQQQLTNVHLLIVDDEPVNRKILIHVANSLQYSYTAVGSGEEALAILKRGRLPDLLLLDVMMPGISGLDVCKEIRKTHGLGELPVLMLTAFGQKRDLAAAFTAGANDILQKPFDMSELRARMQSLLAMKQSFELSIRKEMDFLQAQITPHFLYNSLNAVVGLSYTDTQKLRELIVNLSTYLRSKFTFLSVSGVIPFERELELVEAYLAIEEVRFGGQFKIVYHIEDDFHCMLPPLILQPIVENAVRHGVAVKDGEGVIQIHARMTERGAEIVVADNGAGMKEERLQAIAEGTTGRVGIENVNRRLSMLYGRKLIIDSKAGEGTQVTIIIPEEEIHEGDIN
ncbi:ATP-binding protein [Paenibacillus septentrionalis]|uniref:histidine kinase n=1 Tax=Paenibacillus septentrionalis TaxID=429342 RepID=A0ABW1V7K0_9BACL